MSFFLTPLICSLMTFVIIRRIFKLESRMQIQIDAVMIGLYTLLYIGGVGIIGHDWAMAGLNMLGVLVGLTIYRSCIGWPSGRTMLDAFRQPKPTFVAPDDDPRWLNYHP